VTIRTFIGADGALAGLSLLAMGRKLLGGAQEAIGIADAVARHVIWYLSYQIDGTARDDEYAQRLGRDAA